MCQDFLQSSGCSSRETAGRPLAEIFRQGIAEGVFQPADPLLLARMFVGVFLLLSAISLWPTALNTGVD